MKIFFWAHLQFVEICFYESGFGCLSGFGDVSSSKAIGIIIRSPRLKKKQNKINQ